MIKLLSVKTRRTGSTRDEFRSHYEGRHVPLGLGYIDRFRWRKYVRSHVLEVWSGEVDFDCLTEFWYGSREDQEAMGRFAASPEFEGLKEDDRRFLDVDRRLACELEESVVAGVRPDFDPPGTRRLAAIFSRPERGDAKAFVDEIEAEVTRLAQAGIESGARVSFDRRMTDGARPTEFAAIASLWWPPGRVPTGFAGGWKTAPDAEVLLDVVETPPERLHRGA
jgi:hypothetical protein